MSIINMESLERKTRRYWRNYDHANPEPCLEQYIDELLLEETKHAQES